MPRWLQVALTLVLFTAVMLAVGWVAKQVVPAVLTPIAFHTGWSAIVSVGIVLAIVALVFSLWPRDESGRMKRLTLRR